MISLRHLNYMIREGEGEYTYASKQEVAKKRAKLVSERNPGVDIKLYKLIGVYTTKATYKIDVEEEDE